MMKKRILSIVLALIMLIGVIPMTMLSASAEVDEGGSGQGLQMPTPQNVQATFIGFVDPSGKNAVVVEISWDAMPTDIDGGNKFVEMYPSLKENANLSLPMSFEAWMGQATLIPVEELQQGGIGYVTKDGRSTLRSVVHILQPGELKVDDNGMACGIKENDVIDIDIYTAGYDPKTQTDGESGHKHVEIVYTEENVKNKKTFKEAGAEECSHENKESKGQFNNVNGRTYINGKLTLFALFRATDECSVCHKETVTRVYRLKFKTRTQMQRYLSGKYAKLKNGKSVHFKGKFEKIEKVYWNKKYIKVSKTYNKKKGSVILDFTDDFLATVEDGIHELVVCNGDEFTAMTVTVEDHQMVELGAFDIDDHAEITADQYEALMQECEDNDIEVIDCDLDEFYEGGFMVNAEEAEVTMSLSANMIRYTGKAVTPPAVTLTSENGVEYAEGEDYALTYYKASDDEDGEPAEVDPEAITETGTYTVVAVPTGSGALSGEAWMEFKVADDMPIILGDADDDGEVSIFDATAIQRSLAALPTDSFVEGAADTDGDGEVTILDATHIQRYLAGMDYPVGIGDLIGGDGSLDGGSASGVPFPGGAILRWVKVELYGNTPNFMVAFANNTDKDIVIEMSKFSIIDGDTTYDIFSGARTVRRNSPYLQYTVTTKEGIKEGDKVKVMYDGELIKEVTVTTI